MTTKPPMLLRSKLNVPGDRPDLFSDAFASAADAVSLDLEDSVGPARKPTARQEISALMGKGGGMLGGKIVMVRINALDVGMLEEDLDCAVRQGIDLITMPKAESAAAVRELDAALAKVERLRGIDKPIGLAVMIETPLSLRKAAEVACAAPRVAGLLIGYADLFEPLGIDREDPYALANIRLAVRMAAAEADLDMILDGVYMNLARPDLYRLDAERGRAVGITGKSCKNDAQVALANEIFGPSPEVVARARRLVAAAEDADLETNGLFEHEGRLVDRPFVEGAQRIIAIADALENRDGMKLDAVTS